MPRVNTCTFHEVHGDGTAGAFAQAHFKVYQRLAPIALLHHRACLGPVRCKGIVQHMGRELPAAARAARDDPVQDEGILSGTGKICSRHGADVRPADLDQDVQAVEVGAFIRRLARTTSTLRTNRPGSARCQSPW